ncbi:hypothetical protein [Kitasatospora sp. NPDC088548]
MQLAQQRVRGRAHQAPLDLGSGLSGAGQGLGRAAGGHEHVGVEEP